MNGALDLVVLVADSDAEWTLQTLLESRTQALGIRRIRAKVIRDPRHDPSVFRHGPELLRAYLAHAGYALALLDREGSGREHQQTAQEMEDDIEERLAQDGWADEHGFRAAAIVLDPELEVWVWSSSPHVARVIGLEQAQLEEVLAGFPANPAGKPECPKKALEAALKRSRRPRSSRIFQELAEQVSLRANERAFDKLRQTLQTWFPLEE
jgi:hypothetical protein